MPDKPMIDFEIDPLLRLCEERFCDPRQTSPQWLIAWTLLKALRKLDVTLDTIAEEMTDAS